MRSGINGTRIHIPGQTQNTYLFLDMNNVSQLDQSALLMKYEWVAGTTEIGTSAWVAPHRASRFGLDMSTHLVGLDISGEWALENEKNWLRVKNTEGVVSVEKGPSIWASSAMINLQRQFNWKRPNRITAIYELYYNGRGYSGDLLKDETMKAVLFSNGLYSANYFSKAYHALFLSINEFPVYATTFSLNAIQNITDQSAILSTGLGYKLTDGLLINSSVLFYLGNANTEYGLSEKHAAVIVQGIITF
jgi:hypothetical protein